MDVVANSCDAHTGRFRRKAAFPKMIIGSLINVRRLEVMKRYMCVICGFIYDEAAGLPDDGIVPGTKWDDIPMTWRCPDCSARKDEFEMIEI